MKKFKIDISFVFTSIVFLLSYYQSEYLKLLVCIFFHEIGHIIIIYIFKINIKNIRLYSFGFILELDYYKKFPIKDLMIYTFGILFNLILYIFIDSFRKINLTLILVNLIPFYPMDGYNILNIILSLLMPYKIALYVSSYISLIVLIILSAIMLKSLDILLLILIIYLFILWLNNHKSIKENYNNYLITRYLRKESYKTKKVRLSYLLLDSFYKYRSIYCEYQNKRIEENELIELKYNIN